MRSPEKWSVLALLRFVLAAIVTVNHLGEYTDLRSLAVVPRFGAFEAILGFLLISGYSVGTSFLAKPKGFLLRRLQRIYPIYLAAIVLTFLVEPAQPTFAFLTSIALNLAFLNQALTTTSYVGPAWSLSLEFWLYALANWFSRQSESRLRLLTYASFAAYCVYTCVRTLLHAPYYSGVGLGANLVFLSFAWLCGFELARFGSESARRRTLAELGVFLGVHLVLQSGIQFLHQVKHDQIQDFFRRDLADGLCQATTLLIVWLAFRFFVVNDGGRQVRKESAVMRLLGDISYPLYLTHVPVFMLVRRAGVENAYSHFCIAVAAAFVIYEALDQYSKRRGVRLALQ